MFRPGPWRRDCREDDMALDLLSYVSDLRIWPGSCSLFAYLKAEEEDSAAFDNAEALLIQVPAKAGCTFRCLRQTSSPSFYRTYHMILMILVVTIVRAIAYLC